jgi:hypothetical protein
MKANVKNQVNNVVTKKAATKNSRVENLIVTNQVKEPKVKVVKVAKTKEEIKEKRLLNPQFSHLVSKQKKTNELLYKSDATKVLIGAKKIIDSIEIESYNLYENANLIEKCKSFINFVTKTNKQNEIINVDLYKGILNNVRTTKGGLYTEFYFAQLVQKIVTLSINKGFDFQTALNIVIEQKRQSKK